MDLNLSKRIFEELVQKYGQAYDVEMNSEGCVEIHPKEGVETEPEVELQVLTTPQVIAPIQSAVAPALTKLMK